MLGGGASMMTGTIVYCTVERLEGRMMLATFYVAPGGANTNAGSAAAPWQTLQYAADHVGAADHVIAAAGNYVGFDIRHGGTSANRITFTGESGATINQPN